MRSRLVVLLAFAAVLLAVPSVASGHAELDTATPGAGDNVAGSPAELVLTFTQDLDMARTTVEVRDASGATVAERPELAGPRELRLALPELAPGVYLGIVLVAYTVLTLIGMANFGRDAWRTQAETFTVWFDLLNRMAPFAPAPGGDARRLIRRRFGAGLVRGEWTTPTLVIVAISVGSILYDGLSQTQVWFDTFGFPALPVATLELLTFLSAVIGVALLVARFVGLAAVGAGLLPIAMGYLVAHYLTYLLGDGQLIVVALSDPFQLGWDLFGTAFYEPNYAVFPPLLVWTVMLVGVVGGHMVGAWSGHVVASEGAPGDERRTARLRQIPLAFLMVGLTATTLWSLGQAIVKEEPPAASATSAAVAPSRAALPSAAAAPSGAAAHSAVAALPARPR